MKMELAQLGAMIKYEFSMQWRRRGLPVVTLAVIVVSVFAALLIRSYLYEIVTTWVAQGGVTRADAQREVIKNLFPANWLILYAAIVIVVPIVMADVIPADRQIKVRELLGSLPLTPAIYLAGKLLSVLVSMVLVVVLVTVGVAMSWWAIVGPFDLGIYLQGWLLGGIAMVLINAGLVTLIASAMPNRRLATFIGAAFALAMATLGFSNLTPAMGEKPNFWHLMHPGRPVIVEYMIVEVGQSAVNFGSTLDAWDFTLAVIVGLAQNILLLLAAWAWMRRRDVV